MLMEKRICLRCDHGWYPRKEGASVQCPRCRSPYWNIPKKECAGEVKVIAAVEKKSELVAGFRGAGKCPHDYINWMVCRNVGGGCK